MEDISDTSDAVCLPAPIWPEAEQSIHVLSALGYTLTVPEGWAIRRTPRSIAADPPAHTLTDATAYEFAFHTVQSSLEATLRTAAGAATLRVDKLRHVGAARSGLLLSGVLQTVDGTLDVCAVAERLDDGRHCVVHVVREWSHAAHSAMNRMLMIWQHAGRASHGDDDRKRSLTWVNEAAGLQIRMPNVWRTEHDEPCLLTARAPSHSPIQPDLLVAVDASATRPRSVWQMVERCQAEPQDWARTRIGNRAALMRSMPRAAGSDQPVCQILPDPSDDAAVFIELRSAELLDSASTRANTAHTALPHFRWIC